MSFEFEERPEPVFAAKPFVCTTDRSIAALRWIMRKHKPNAYGTATQKNGVMFYFNNETGRRSSELLFKVFVPHSKRDEYAPQVEHIFNMVQDTVNSR